MTKDEAKKMLKAKLECLKRETSGTDIDCNHRNCDECNLCYEQGNMGEQKEALDMAIKALEHMNVIDKIRAEIAEYGSIWVEYKITGRRDKDIERLVSDVLKQAKEEVLEIIDKYRAESEDK